MRHQPSRSPCSVHACCQPRPSSLELSCFWLSPAVRACSSLHCQGMLFFPAVKVCSSLASGWLSSCLFRSQILSSPCELSALRSPASTAHFVLLRVFVAHVLTHMSSTSTRCSTCCAWYTGCFPSHSPPPRVVSGSAPVHRVVEARCGNRLGLDASRRHLVRGPLLGKCQREAAIVHRGPCEPRESG